MSGYQTVALLVTLAALFSYLNYRFVRLPTTIGVMVIALALSLVLVAFSNFGHVGDPLKRQAERLLHTFDFNTLLLQGFLPFLLFAGALHIDLSELGQQKWGITLLATVGTAMSTVIVGLLTWGALRAIGLELRVIDCLLFGALISPTDPIAVLAIMRTAGAPPALETKIAGESLFNDGIGVVLFLVLEEVAAAGGGGVGHAPVTPAHVVLLLVMEAAGGAAFGLAAGALVYHMLKRVNNYQVEVLLTLALAIGAYTLANALNLSGPIAIVVAGLLIGNHGRAFAMSGQTRRHLDMFWVLVDDILNAVLFVLIGLVVLVMPFTLRYLAAGLLVIPITLLARWLSVVGMVGIWRPRQQAVPGAIAIMTWAGLRGGISVALALSLHESLGRNAPVTRNVIVAITYAVVVFSIIVQGLTVAPLVRRKLGEAGIAVSPPKEHAEAAT
jgi:CPA1 family monovalent cation:H+ antiporter